MTNRDIARLFGGLSYSAIAKVQSRFQEKLGKDRKLMKNVADIERRMSNVNSLSRSDP